MTQAIEALKTLRIAGEPQKSEEPDRIAVVELADSYELTVPVSRLLMSIPKEGLVQVPDNREGSTASKRYFYLEDKQKHLILSGWFEAQEEFRGIEKFWASEIGAWKQKKIPLPEETAFKKIGNWDAVVYQMHRAAGSNPHIRAHSPGRNLDRPSSIDRV